jgi:hypothetical protein
MGTLILVLCLLLLACIVVGAVAVTAVLLIHLWRWARRTDTYEPAAAEAPMGCGCVFRNVQYTCMRCGDKRCEEHRDTPHACSDTAFADVQEVLADDVPSELEVELYDAIRRHHAGEDVTAGAPREQP